MLLPCPGVRDGGGGSTERALTLLEASPGGEEEESRYRWSENPPGELGEPWQPPRPG